MSLMDKAMVINYIAYHIQYTLKALPHLCGAYAITLAPASRTQQPFPQQLPLPMT